MRDGMMTYVVGLVMIFGAVELALALFLVIRTAVPSLPLLFWVVYSALLAILTVAGGSFVYRGLGALREERRAATLPSDPPSP